ncbi:MAG TPA: amino acid adenylation domain-containing protein, partial [Trebonia sp.]
MSDLSARLTDLSPVKRALMRRLAEGKAEASSVAGSGLVIPQLPGDGPFPLSYAQERVWFTSQLAPNVPLFNLAGGIRYPGVPDVAELEQRATAAMRRHDVLRMSVQVIDDEPASLLVPATRVRVPVLDRSSADPADADTIAREAVLEVGAAAYRLDEAPLWRVALVRLPGGEQMLVMSAHHIILDGPSLARLGYELLVPQARPALPVRYADFAAWQKRSVRDGALADELDYWRGELASLPPPLDLPISRSRPARRSLRGATIGAGVPGDLLRQVRQFSGDQKVTPFTVFLSAFIALLHRYTGLDDILVGTPLSGRPLPELHDLLGMFVNLVPLRVRLTSTTSFRELLAQTNRALAAAQARPGVPFELLVSELGLGGSRSYPPLIQVGFNMPVPVVPPTVRLADVPYAPEGAQLDLTAQIMPRGADGLQVLFEFASDLFEESAIRRMIGQYLLLAKELTVDPGRAIGAVPLLSARDQAVLTAGSGPGGARHALEQPGEPGGLPPAPLHELVTAQARRTPRNVAVLSGHRTLSYAELVSRADAVTAGLRRHGVGPETLVGVCLGPGLELPVALLAIWQAGGAYVPLDPGLPTARIEQILAESGVGVVLTRRDLASALPAAEHQVLCVDEIPAGPRPVPAAVSLANAAYVIHTSGSTGSPKGVIVTHGGIANRVLWTIRAHGLGATDRVLQRTRLGFDAAGWEVFAPLVSGGTVVMPAAGADSDPRALLEAVGDQQVTVLQVVPSILRALAEDGDWSRCGSLRLLLSAGEPLEGDLCARIRELTGAQIVNTYGPAECAIDATAATVDPAGHSGRVPIGRPIDNMRALVLDPAMRPVPVGLPGELYLGGIGVGRGYHGRPGLTAASFVADPYDPLGGRLYRTGDLARWREDGSLEFLGRRDHQVKISGVRVELGEIEIHLASHPAVREAVVTAPADGTGGRRLVAYVVGDASHHELRSFLRERLPAAMIPGIFRTLETLPRTVGGKVDRASLSSPDPSVRPADEAYLPPRDYTEQAIATAWAELLQITRVSADDDFFALGGQSLLLIRLAGRLRTMFDVELSIADLFAAPTVQSQARLVAASRAAALEPVQRASRAEPLPLSAG